MLEAQIDNSSDQSLFPDKNSKDKNNAALKERGAAPDKANLVDDDKGC